MNLLEAFRELAPSIGDDATVARRNDAMAIVYHELHLLAGRIWPNAESEDRKDIASKVFCNLTQNGPRGLRDGDPSSDGAVRGFLISAIENGLRDIRRSQKQFDSAEKLSNYPAASEPADEVTRREAQREIDAARHQLFDVIVPELAQRSRSGTALIETVGQLRKINAGRLSVKEVLDDECGDVRDEGALQRARNRLDQRLGRARGRIDDEVTRLRDSGQVTEGRARTLKSILEHLKLRQ